VGIALAFLDVVCTVLLFVVGALTGHVVGVRIGPLVSLAPTAAFGTLLLAGWLPAYRRRSTIPNRETFTGQVVKRWTYESGGEDGTTHYCCCIDDGTSPEGWSFRIERSVYTQMHVGDIVHVDFNPRWHTLNRIQLAAPAPGARS